MKLILFKVQNVKENFLQLVLECQGQYKQSCGQKKHVST